MLNIKILKNQHFIKSHDIFTSFENFIKKFMTIDMRIPANTGYLVIRFENSIKKFMTIDMRIPANTGYLVIRFENSIKKFMTIGMRIPPNTGYLVVVRVFSTLSNLITSLCGFRAHQPSHDIVKFDHIMWL